MYLKLSRWRRTGRCQHQCSFDRRCLKQSHWPRSGKKKMVTLLAMESANADEWKAAAQTRFNEFLANDVFELVDRPKDQTVIKVKPVFRTKYLADGTIDRRTRIAAKGYIQNYDPDEMFPPIASYETIRICPDIAALLHFEVADIIDFTAAFSVYTEQPPGMNDRTNRVWLLKEALEGLHHSGKAWYSTLVQTLIELGFEKVISLPCHIYNKEGIYVLVPIYVDDKLLLCNSRKFADELIKKLQARHKLRYLGPVKLLLGMTIERDLQNCTVTFNSTSYIDKVLKAFRMEPCGEVATPMIEGSSLSRLDGPASKRNRQCCTSITKPLYKLRRSRNIRVKPSI